MRQFWKEFSVKLDATIVNQYQTGYLSLLCIWHWHIMNRDINFFKNQHPTNALDNNKEMSKVFKLLIRKIF